MCREAGLIGNYTSHSAKASCATQLFDARLDEQLIQERTGHRSEKAVRRYKRTTSALTKHVSSVLDGVTVPQAAGPSDVGPSPKKAKHSSRGKLQKKKSTLQ